MVSYPTSLALQPASLTCPLGPWSLVTSSRLCCHRGSRCPWSRSDPKPFRVFSWLTSEPLQKVKLLASLLRFIWKPKMLKS